MTATSEQLLSEFSMERLSSPVKKVNTLVFKSCEKKEKVKTNQTVYDLQGHCNFCALVASQREIDMKVIIGHYELSSVCYSFMDSGGELNHSAKAKFKLVDVLTKHVNRSKISASECPSADIVAIDAIQVVQKMSKPAPVKATFKDLEDVFCQDGEKFMGSCRVVIITFDTYYDISLKNFTPSRRLGNAVPLEFTVDDAFGISDASLKEILSHTRTK